MAHIILAYIYIYNEYYFSAGCLLGEYTGTSDKSPRPSSYRLFRAIYPPLIFRPYNLAFNPINGPGVLVHKHRELSGSIMTYC